MGSIHSLQKKTSQTATHTLFIVQNIKFVNKLIHIIATFCYDTKVGHQTKVIALLKKLII